MSETTPLLAADKPASIGRFFSPYRRVLVATFILSNAFFFTATPLLFVMRKMACDSWYLHETYEGTGDRCAVKEVEAFSARHIAVMISGTTIAGVLNLLVTTWQIRHWGIRMALIQQTSWPCLRNLCQTTAVYLGYMPGVRIMQLTQYITILGGGAGYFLAANSYVAELIPPEERTAAFGVLQGVAMLGTATGYTLGGLAGDAYLPLPFQITLGLLVVSTIFTSTCLPYIPPAASIPPPFTSSDDKKKESAFSFLDCMKVFLPVRLDESRNKGAFWGLTLLGTGAFIGVLATSYVPLMLQLIATNHYGFHPSQSGYLMSTNSLCRALFLTILFPKIIARGRKWYTSAGVVPTPAEQDPLLAPLPVEASAFEPHPISGGGDDGAEEPARIPKPTDKAHGSHFDLAFLRWSMVIDALLTGLVGFNTQGWHVYAAAGILPLASGTAPACKGVILELVPPDKRADALSAIALVETLAMISSTAILGVVFSALSDWGRPHWIFYIDGLLALSAAGVLMLVRFPSRVKGDVEEEA